MWTDYTSKEYGKWEISSWDPRDEVRTVKTIHRCRRCGYTDNKVWHSSERRHIRDVNCVNMEHCKDFPMKCFCCKHNTKDYYESKGNCVK
jgi:hypothetical protein